MGRGGSVKTVLAVWVRGKTDEMVDERSRRIEEVKAENDTTVVPLLLGDLAAKQRNSLKSPFSHDDYN